ncbi:unnamed protein product, partial [Nesidiocoris tenuis]
MNKMIKRAATTTAMSIALVMGMSFVCCFMVVLPAREKQVCALRYLNGLRISQWRDSGGIVKIGTDVPRCKLEPNYPQ